MRFFSPCVALATVLALGALLVCSSATLVDGKRLAAVQKHGSAAVLDARQDTTALQVKGAGVCDPCTASTCQKETVKAHTEIFWLHSCRPGFYAVVSRLRVDVSDDSKFSVRTSDPSSPNESFIEGTTDVHTKVGCFQKGSLPVGRSQTRAIRVGVTCQNWADACPLRVDVAFTCRALGVQNLIGATAPKVVPTLKLKDKKKPSKSAPARSIARVEANTAAAAPAVAATKQATSPASDTAAAKFRTSCSCRCCSGNGCEAALVGSPTVMSCQSDGTCSDACRVSFPAKCPAAGKSGSMSALCTQSTVTVSTNRTTTGPAVAGAQASGSSPGLFKKIFIKLGFTKG